MKEYWKLILCILISEFVGILGSVFTSSSIPTWYAGLQKPTFSPPNWIFGPVWTILYFLMGVSAYLVLRNGVKRRDVRIALYVFGIQLTLNFFWSLIFFGLRSPIFAFVEIIVLWLSIAITIYLFYRISKPAGLLLVPYILWVSFASVLNFSIWKLNYSEAYVNQQIESANYCSADEDCIILDSKCPFDCYVYINKEKQKEIETIIQNFPSKCVYGCVQPPKQVICQNKKCVPKE